MERNEKWYDEFHKRLIERAKEDELCCRNLKDSNELMVLFAKMDLSEYKRRIIEDWVACMLSLAERHMELAYEMGLEDAKTE